MRRRRHLVHPLRPPTSAAAANRRERHIGADRAVSRERYLSEVRRLRAALRALPAIDAHCLAHGAERPDIEAIVERAEKYIDAYERAAALRPMDRRLERAASILRHLVEDLGPWGVQL